MPDELLLLREKHIRFIRILYRLPADSLEALFTQHIRINGIYWALVSLHLLDRVDVLPRTELIAEILACRDPSGGFGSAPGHDAHVVCTLHAVQILVLLGCLEESIDTLATARWIAHLQVLPQGAIQGDRWGELDMRINYAATQCLALLGHLDLINRGALRRYVLQCRNFDGGFGMVPGAESHAAHAFTSLGTLAILAHHEDSTSSPSSPSSHMRGTGRKQETDLLEDPDRTAWWLSLRQGQTGGFNGRPEKLEDVCYSWYVLSSLSILHRLDWIDSPRLRLFILSAQDRQAGGISDRPGDLADINHTCFGLAGLAILRRDGLCEIDPRYCMPRDIIARLGL